MLNLVHVLYLVVPQSFQPKNKLSLANYHKALDPNQKFNAQQPANTCVTKQKAIIDKKRSTIKVCSIFTLQFGIQTFSCYHYLLLSSNDHATPQRTTPYHATPCHTTPQHTITRPVQHSMHQELRLEIVLVSTWHEDLFINSQ